MSTKKSNVISGQSNIFNYSNKSITAYDAFLASWQEFIARDGWQSSSNDEHHDIESFAVQTLSSLVTKGDNASEYNANPFFSSLHNSAIICNADGIVLNANKQAMRDYAITPEANIDSLNIQLEDGISLATKLQAVITDKTSDSRLSLLQCRRIDKEASLSIAIMKLEEKFENKSKAKSKGKLNEKEISVTHALVIFLDAACNIDAVNLFSVKFGLTKAETDVASSFSSGVSLKDIAKTRYRSYTTIRNQFQSILEKTGCKNQADLLRMLLGISYLLSFAEIVSKTEKTAETETTKKKTCGKKIEVMRPHGRFLDVRLYGDLEGEPFIVLPSIFGMPISESIEAQLRSRSLLMIGVWRPGFADTSKQHKSDDYYQCVADDIKAVLDNIGVERVPLMGRASAARTVFNLARIIPERISAACVVNSLVPLPFITKYKIVSKWTKALVSAFEYSPSFATLILETGRRLLIRDGGKKFIKKMYNTSPSDLRLVTDPDVMSCLQQGVLLASRQGFLAPTQDMIDGFKDWSSDVENSPIKVALLQGRNDPNISIEASRDFAKHFPEQVELIEFADGGGLLNYSHTHEILDWIEKGVG